jgi:sulfite dehydrogenase
MRRRDFIKFAGAAGAAALAGCATPGSGAKGRVVIIGGGYGGATAARYLRMWEPAIDVVMVERNDAFTSCPMSNLVLGGNRSIEEIRRTYDGLRRRGVRVVQDDATAIDAAKKVVRLQRGGELSYDRLIVSPGVDFNIGEIEGYQAAQDRFLHAWKAGPQTVALRRKLEAMRDGGVYVLAVPLAPYRCPPGPYERASQVAHYFKRAKPRSKVLILDANPDVTSKGPLFKRAWADLYKDIIEFRGNSKVVAVDAVGMAVRTEFDTVKGDVLNVVE